MGVVDFAEAFGAAIVAGQTIVEGNVVRIIADNGAAIGNATVKVVSGGNGTAATVYQMTGEVASGTAKTTGVSFLAIDLGVAGAAIAPALGVLAGAGVYKLSPYFWDRLSSNLINSGKTIGGKVIAFWNGENLYFDEETIEIMKQELVDMGIFQFQLPEFANTGTITMTGHLSASQMLSDILSRSPYSVTWYGDAQSKLLNILSQYPNYIPFGGYQTTQYPGGHSGAGLFVLILIPPNETGVYTLGNTANGISVNIYSRGDSGSGIAEIYDVNSSGNVGQLLFVGEYYNSGNDKQYISGMNAGRNSDVDLQSPAIYPDDDEFPLRYPEWYPLNYPEGSPDPSELPKIYPVKYPTTEPDPYPKQDPAQNPDPESDPDTYPYIIPDLPLPQPTPNPQPNPDPTPDPSPEPNPDPTPTPAPTPDPDPQPTPEPIPDPDPYPDPTPDPVNPNPEPTPTPVIPITPLPDTVNSSKLFTVYNPTGAQLDALGGYLWDSSLMATLRDIWQDPLDGIISLIQVYATPAVGGSSNIILGYLDSGVSSAVVSSQFVTIDCGSVSLKENKHNATDYAPYTSLHLYLPFIGIVELDTNECMKSTINVIYKVDVYTGTCLALVKITRTKDLPNGGILYTYSGNCAQQLPLTSGNATGMFSALIGGITAGLSVASGGGLGVLAGASILGNSLNHEMFHVSHSGNISANAGIMGNKKPYLIIGRRAGYDANNYNAFYGYPANKTVVLGNYKGFVRVKKCFMRTVATQPEHDEIMALLSDGVIL